MVIAIASPKLENNIAVDGSLTQVRPSLASPKVGPSAGVMELLVPADRFRPRARVYIEQKNIRLIGIEWPEIGSSAPLAVRTMMEI